MDALPLHTHLHLARHVDYGDASVTEEPLTQEETHDVGQISNERICLLVGFRRCGYGLHNHIWVVESSHQPAVRYDQSARPDARPRHAQVERFQIPAKHSLHSYVLRIDLLDLEWQVVRVVRNFFSRCVGD